MKGKVSLVLLAVFLSMGLLFAQGAKEPASSGPVEITFWSLFTEVTGVLRCDGQVIQ
jgi:hypothetical protein